MRRKILATMLLSSVALGIIAQNLQITGKIKDASSQEEIEFANITLRTTDSLFITGTTSGNGGTFTLANLASGNYLLIVSYLGYTPETILIESMTGSLQLDDIQLHNVVNALDEITVTAIRPTVKFREGKFIYNVQDNADFKVLNSLSDILNRLPLVTTDNDKVNILGKRNTIVLIDGIPPKNNNWDLITPEQIKDIEIITNPSAEYSSEGMAVINIITRRKVANGLNGQLTTSLMKGKKYRTDNGFMLEYAGEKLNLYTQARYNLGKKIITDTYERYFPEGAELYNIMPQTRKSTGDYSIIAGSDFYLHPQHTIGLQYQHIVFDITRNTPNTSDLFTNEGYHWKNNTNIDGTYKTGRNIYDLNYTYHADETGKRLNLNMGYVDYTSDENNQIQTQSNSFADQKQSQAEATIQILTANLDYTFTTHKEVKIKTGLYHSYTRNNSNYNLTGQENNDILPGNEVNIREKKSAAYLTARKNWNKLHLHGGLRFEHASYTNNDKWDEQISRTYNDLFPSLEIGYDIHEKLQTNLSFTRKINYPSFQDLDPSFQYIDTLTYRVGNINLKPEYSYNTQLNVVLNRLYTWSLTYSKINEPIIPFFIKRLDPTSLIGIATSENIISQDSWNTSFTIPIQHKRWMIQNSIGANHNQVHFLNEDIRTNISKTTFYFYNYQSLRLPADYNLSLSYQYNSSGINGIIHYNSRHILNMGATKTLHKDKLQITLRYDDIFNQNKSKVWVDINGIRCVQSVDYEASFITLSLKYKFGSSQNKYTVKENTQSESNRIK